MAIAPALLLVLITFTHWHSAQASLSEDALSEVARSNNQSLLWGPYRPNLYFGVRPRLPHSLMTGLLWARVEDFQSAQNNFRYTCEQNEGMAGYGWDEYDVRTGGRQTIHDTGNQLDLQTEFVKVPGGTHGGSWGVRIKGTPREGAAPNLRSTVIFSATWEGPGGLEVDSGIAEAGFDDAVTLSGSSPDLGEFTIDVTAGPRTNRHPRHNHPSYQTKPLDRTFVHSFQVSEDALWQTKQLLFTSLKQAVDSYTEKYGRENIAPPWQVYTIPHLPGKGNIHLVQKVFEGPFEFDVLFSSGSAAERLTSARLTRAINDASLSFAQRFAQVFKPEPPFTEPHYEQFSRSLFSNLLGGIGYFYGDAIVDRSYAVEYEEENEGFWEETAEARARNQQKLEGPYELFTSIPSRPFFPRGFLWDEGFHLLPVFDWDVDLTLDIVKSWFSLADENGWIAREQILGPEARSKVPPEFQVQYPHYANPPTLFLILDAFVERLLQRMNGTAATGADADAGAGIGADGERRTAPHSTYLDQPAVGLQYLRELYPHLRRHYLWFRRTQRGEVRAYERAAHSAREAYRWRGRTPRHLLPSGLDDYPRAQPPHPGELHVDLLAWVGAMARSMHAIAAALGGDAAADDAAEFAGHAAAIARNLDDLHWDGGARAYCDATIDAYEDSVHACHKGYLSLFPFMLGLLPRGRNGENDERVAAMLDLIGDADELWSEFGIRSLSKRSEFYGTDENYWRGPIWINMNYLIIQRLLELAQQAGPHQARAAHLYRRLRRNVVDNVYRQWQQTGFAWEQYNAETGAGQRTQHFTGWTSLVAKIMTLPDVPDGAQGEAGSAAATSAATATATATTTVSVASVAAATASNGDGDGDLASSSSVSLSPSPPSAPSSSSPHDEL